MRVLNYFNIRTLVALIISQIATFIAIQFQIKFNLNLALFGLAVVFPLHFSIQAAFKRRERALEYFSLFKAGLMMLHYSIHISKDLPDEKKAQGTNLLKAAYDELVRQLNIYVGYESIQRKLNEVFAFMQTYQEELSKRNSLRMIKYMGVVSDSSVFLTSLASHRTMAGLRFYSLLFILIFPLVHAPILLHHLEGVVPEFVLYTFTGLGSLVLITLNNFQYLIEYPFDQQGLDSVKLKEFKLDV
jgi:hypothetical protein